MKLLRCAGAAALLLGALKYCWPRAAAEPAVFSLGLISDVQWADADDGWNFARTTRRCFRGALIQLTRAVDWWRDQELVAVAQLGDLIDGRNAATGQSESAMAAAISQLRRLSVVVLHAVGNHDLYNFPRAQLTAQLYGADLYYAFNGAKSYYAFVPHAGWRILVLDTFQESLIGWPEGDVRRVRATTAIKAHNPNDVTVDGDWFAGLDGLERRWVPYNGALGAAQLTWLRKELRAARHAGERVLVLSHAILHPAACDGTTLTWDYAEALREIHRAGCVVAVVAGHDHAGGYHRDERGVHHLTLRSPLNDGVDGAAYGVLDAAADAIVLRSPQLFSLLPRRAEARLPQPTSAGGGVQAMRFAINASPAGKRERRLK
eukprot:7170082-Prymnesium_polylepis.1